MARCALLVCLVVAVPAVLALHLPVVSRPALRRRGPLANDADRSYHAAIRLAGQNFTVLIDTGSSDLWVAGSTAAAHDTGIRATVNYAQDTVEGPIKTAALVFGEHRIPDQAFLEITPDELHPAGEGILGLGPSTGSIIAPLLTNDSANGDPVLYRVFNQNRTTPNYFTILLGRDKDPTDHFTGNITIGEVLPEYAAILGETKLSITSTASPSASRGDQHLQVFLDQDGIVGPNGSPIVFNTSVPSGSTQPTVVLDSGFTLSQVPKVVADAIYGTFEGAEYVIVPRLGYTWILPCELEVNVTFKFAGKEYPIHPLDMSMDPEPLGFAKFNNSFNENSCLGSFQPFTFERGDTPSYDMILGMAFMRNVYALFDYGDFAGNRSGVADPYIQLLSITDRAEAHADFVAVRQPHGRFVDPETGAEREEGKVHTAIIATVPVIGVLLIIAGLVVYRTRRKSRGTLF